MGWENPPVSWRELERRLSWNVTRLPPGPERDRVGRRAGGSAQDDPPPGADLPPGAELPWAELHCHSSYSFLDGASSPGELVAEARRLGLRALAVTDHDGMYGVAQFAQAAARVRAEYKMDLATVFGAELSLSGARNGGTRNGGTRNGGTRPQPGTERPPAGKPGTSRVPRSRRAAPAGAGPGRRRLQAAVRR